MLASEEFRSVYVDKRGLAKPLVNDEGMIGKTQQVLFPISQYRIT